MRCISKLFGLCPPLRLPRQMPVYLNGFCSADSSLRKYKGMSYSLTTMYSRHTCTKSELMNEDTYVFFSLRTIEYPEVEGDPQGLRPTPGSTPSVKSSAEKLLILQSLAFAYAVHTASSYTSVVQLRSPIASCEAAHSAASERSHLPSTEPELPDLRYYWRSLVDRM